MALDGSEVSPKFLQNVGADVELNRVQNNVAEALRQLWNDTTIAIAAAIAAIPAASSSGGSIDTFVFSGFSRDGSSAGRFLVPGYGQVIATDMFVPVMQAGTLTLVTLKYSQPVPGSAGVSLGTFKVFLNGAAIAFTTITVTGTDSGVAIERNSSTGTQALVAGDLLSVQFAHSGGWLSFHQDFGISIRVAY